VPKGVKDELCQSAGLDRAREVVVSIRDRGAIPV